MAIGWYMDILDMGLDYIVLLTPYVYSPIPMDKGKRIVKIIIYGRFYLFFLLVDFNKI